MTKLIENTVGASDVNVATTDENLSVEQMFQQTKMPSLGRQIFPVIPMHGPTAALFNIRNSTSLNALKANDFELVRAEVICEPSVAISTGMSQESIQDLLSQFGKTTHDIIGKLLRGLANEKENTDVIAFLELKSLLTTPLVLSGITSAQTRLFEIQQKVSELILLTNSQHLRSFEAFAVLPYSALASIMSLFDYAGGHHNDETDLFVGRIGKTSFYLNPMPASTSAYVGISDKMNPSKSSAVFSPYAENVVESVNAQTGQLGFHIYNRYAVTASPLHVLGEEMMHKFLIQ